MTVCIKHRAAVSKDGGCPKCAKQRNAERRAAKQKLQELLAYAEACRKGVA